MARPIKFVRFECPWCAAWKCDNCGHRVWGVNPDVMQWCPRCDSTEGIFIPIRHTSRRIAEEHLEASKVEPRTRTTTTTTTTYRRERSDN